MVLRDFLPPALRGVMVAAFLAAFMSTLGTQLNWGVSYLVNDLYRRFVVREKTEKHYVAVGRLFTILLVLISGYVASQLHSVGQGWQIVLGCGSRGGGLSQQAFSRRRSGYVCQDFIDHGGNHYGGVDRGHFSYSGGIR
jgi:Na+/proline symporter